NSSLRAADAGSEATELPWLIRLDKFVDGQNLAGRTDLVVRSNSTASSLNEAVALDLLAEAGLASHQAAAAAFSVNGAPARLRLVVENLDEFWETEHFPAAGHLYKSEA